METPSEKTLEFLSQFPGMKRITSVGQLVKGEGILILSGDSYTLIPRLRHEIKDGFAHVTSGVKYDGLILEDGNVEPGTEIGILSSVIYDSNLLNRKSFSLSCNGSGKDSR